MKNIELLSENTLFNGINDEEIQKFCTCIDAKEVSVEAETYIFRAGDEVNHVYLILSGSMHIIDEDFWGNRSIIETMQANTLFAEAYVLSGAEHHLVSVIAAEASEYLVADPVKLFEACAKKCPCHEKLIKNTLNILSRKIVRITEKLGHIIKRTTREKILSYLSTCAKQAEGTSFYIPYSRQQLADYLCIERSALSHELAKLKNAGLIRYKKNCFELLGLHQD